MELKIEQGDYVLDDMGRLVGLTGAEALLQRVLVRLQVRRGSFALLPEFGSDLHLLMREKPSVRQALALKYVMRALEPEPVQVQQVLLEAREDAAWLLVKLLWQEEALQVETRLEGDGGNS